MAKLPATPGAPAKPRGLRRLLPLFLRPRALYRFFRDRRASLGAKLVLGAAIAYVIMPVDLIPDVAPIVGWLDDAGVAAAALAYALRKVAEHERALPAGAEPAPTRSG